MKLLKWIRSWRLWVKIAVLVLAVLLVVGGVFGVKAWQMVQHAKDLVQNIQDTGTIGTIDSAEVEQTVPEYQKDYLNLLVVGIDYDEGDELRDYGSPEKANTDLLLYVHYNVKDNKVSVLQIPRDSCVGELTSNQRINRIFAEGDNQENHIANLAKYINEAFGLPVDKYIALDMGAFKEIVDVFGGMEIYLPCDIYVYNEDGSRTLMASAGYGRLNGDDAEIVVRARKQFGQQDLQRLVLQRYVYAAMYRLIKSATLEDMYNYVLPIVSYRVKSDLDFDTMYSLCTKVLKLEGSDIYFVRVPGGSVTVNGQSLYGVDAQALASILNEHFRAAGEADRSAEELTIPSGWNYTNGEVIDEGGYLSDQLAEYDAAVSAASEG